MLGVVLGRGPAHRELAADGQQPQLQDLFLGAQTLLQVGCAGEEFSDGVQADVQRPQVADQGEPGQVGRVVPAVPGRGSLRWEQSRVGIEPDGLD